MTEQKTFGRLVPECKKRGIGRTTAFELAAKGILETFTIGTGRYVYMDSLRTLPERLKNQNLQTYKPAE
jgi:hypothetical protein